MINLPLLLLATLLLIITIEIWRKGILEKNPKLVEAHIYLEFLTLIAYFRSIKLTILGAIVFSLGTIVLIFVSTLALRKKVGEKCAWLRSYKHFNRLTLFFIALMPLTPFVSLL